MHVLHVVNSLEIGGLEKFVVDLTTQLKEIEHSVVCLMAKGDLFYSVNGDCIFLNSPQGMSVSNIPKIQGIIRKKSVDIIHTHNQGPQFYGSIAGKLTGKPIIHTKHGQNSSKLKRRFFLDIFSSFLTDMIVTVSDDARKICLQHLKIPERKVVTILNGVDTDSFYRFADKREYVSDRPFIIGTVARLSLEKNHRCLLDACSILKNENINFQLFLVGDGNQKEQLRAQCELLDLNGRVFFEGVRMDIPAVMNGFDLFVLPSLTEGVSLTLLEAMSCELPVVATNVGGTPEVVEDGKTGFLVPSDDPSMLAQAIAKCVNKSQYNAEMGRAGRARVLDSFSLVQVAEKYLSLYEDLL